MPLSKVSKLHKIIYYILHTQRSTLIAERASKYPLCQHHLLRVRRLSHISVFSSPYFLSLISHSAHVALNHFDPPTPYFLPFDFGWDYFFCLAINLLSRAVVFAPAITLRDNTCAFLPPFPLILHDTMPLLIPYVGISASPPPPLMLIAHDPRSRRKSPAR
ncbi:hypothetical protein SUGI_0055350 [Cryptomeria japonica]|nr:hypothetical protein SUGI_0055350 [Cryptomeria japonica]